MGKLLIAIKRLLRERALPPRLFDKEALDRASYEGNLRVEALLYLIRAERERREE
jgi:hypothetical protein